MGLATTEVPSGRTILRPGHVYDLCRTAVRSMRRAGVRETTIVAITGHRTRSMLDRYNFVDEQDIRDPVVKMATPGLMPRCPGRPR